MSYLRALVNFTNHTKMKIAKVKNIIVVVILLAFGIQASAQSRKYSNEFLAIGVGARGLAMSNSYVANVNDVTAGYWNPSGLLGIDNDYQVALMHSEYFAGIAKFDYGAISKILDENSVAAFSVIRFGVDDIPNTTQLIDNEGNIDYDRITKFSASDLAFLFSYARNLGIPNLSVGANFKIIRRKVGDFGGAWGFGLDLGAQYQVNDWRLGGVLRDVTSTFNAWSFNLNEETKAVFQATGNELPGSSLELTLPRLLLGVSRKFPVKEKFSIAPEINLDFTLDGRRNVLIKGDPISIDPHFGFEAGYKDVVFLRGGIGNVQRVMDINGAEKLSMQPNMGVGVKIKMVQLDYALTDVGDLSVALLSNVFSLKFDINQSNKK